MELSGSAPGAGRALAERSEQHARPHAAHAAPMAALDAATVAQQLRGADTRATALDALDAHALPIPVDLAVAAAPALGELLALDAAEVDQEQFDRVGLLLARLLTEAAADDAVAPVFGAAFGGGRYAAMLRAENVLFRALRRPAAELTLADARSYACYQAHMSPAVCCRDCTRPLAAAGLSAKDWFGLLMIKACRDRKQMPLDDVPRRVLQLTLELFTSDELRLPELAVVGAWTCIEDFTVGRPAVGRMALENDICGLAAAHLREIGSAADWVVSGAPRLTRAVVSLYVSAADAN